MWTGARSGLLAALSLPYILAASAASASVIYVDADATGPSHDGSSWCSAYVHLQDALNETAASGGAVTEIHLADGVYTPDQGGGQTPGDREATFQLLNGVAIMGGYAGCGAPNPNDRDIATYEAVLSGDLNGDDLSAGASDCCVSHDGPGCDMESCRDLVCSNPGYEGCCTIGWTAKCADMAFMICGMACQADTNENSLHVTTGNYTDRTAVIDGVVISSGSANGPTSYYWQTGAGMSNYRGSPTVRGCIFRRNRVDRLGGGMMNRYGTDPLVTNCTFTANTGDLASGAYGIAIDPGGRATVVNCLFVRNIGGPSSHGGALLVAQGELELIGCRFVENRAGLASGAMDIASSSVVSVQNCEFMNNYSGGAGGAVSHAHETVVTYANCLFYGNSAARGGVAFGTEFEAVSFTNCILTGNSATDRGSAFYHYQPPTNMSLTNCIVWDNHDSEGTGPESLIFNESGLAQTIVNYSCIQGGWTGVGNIDLDPMFVDASSGNLRLLSGSPCIDAGDNTALPADEFDLDSDGDTLEPIPFDLDGLARFVDDQTMPDTGNGTPPIVDMGAFETSDDCNLNGMPDAIDLLDGTSADCNANATPDECDVASGASTDCNTNNVPDDCDIAEGAGTDCNGNALPDACDLAAGASNDCNGNTTLDECDIAAGTSSDTDGNGVPDECQGQPVPAVSTWGMLILALTLLSAGKAVAIRRRHESA